MAIITLYKIKVNLEALEATGMKITKSMYNKYKDPVYTESIYRASLIRSYYGSEYVDVKEAEVAVDWVDMNWTEISGVASLK